MLISHRTYRRVLALVVTALTSMGLALSGVETAQAQPFRDREIVAVIGLDGQLWVSGLAGSQWQPLGGRLVDAPAVVRVSEDLYFLGLGTDHNVWIRTPSQGWRPFGPDGTYCSGPGADWVAANTLAVACRGADGGAWLVTVPVPLQTGVVPTARGAGSSGWQPLGGLIKYGTAITKYPPRPQEEPDLAVVAVGADDRPWFYVPGAGWRQFSAEACGGPLAASSLPFEVLACAAPDGQLKVFHPASGPGATLLGGRLTGRPAIADFLSGQVDFFVLGTDDGVWLTRQRPDGGQDPYLRLPAAGRWGLSAVAPR